MIIRWLGAYGHATDLASSLSWELGVNRKAVCAERLVNGHAGVADRAKVGLIVKNSAVVRRFREDVWSVRNDSGYLRKTRKGCGGFGDHTEVWIQPQFIGLVVRGKWAAISRDAQKTLLDAAQQYSLPVYVLANDQLNKLEKGGVM